jgi:OOP family OmpA-OmpF porin
MLSTIKFVVAAAACSLLCACAAPPVMQESASGANAGEFGNALAQDYRALSEAERLQGDRRDAGAYALRGAAAAMGQPPPPDEVQARAFLKEAYVPELSEARQRLVTALDGTARDQAPAEAARAQASYDCWLEQAAEDLQPEHIDACKSAFLAAMDAVDAKLAATPEPEVAAAPPPPAPPPTPAAPDNYLVFFDFDKAELTADAMRILENVEAAAGGDEAAVRRILAVGHADTSGSDAYNLRLSERRAEAVRAELAARNVKAESIVTDARGEKEPLVPTGDGVREPQNRRVEITLER